MLSTLQMLSHSICTTALRVGSIPLPKVTQPYCGARICTRGHLAPKPCSVDTYSLYSTFYPTPGLNLYVVSLNMTQTFETLLILWPPCLVQTTVSQTHVMESRRVRKKGELLVICDPFACAPAGSGGNLSHYYQSGRTSGEPLFPVTPTPPCSAPTLPTPFRLSCL